MTNIKLPSQEKPWLKYYNEGVYEKALDAPKDKTVWQFFKPIIEKYGDESIIKYFNRSFSGEEYINLIEHWARTFRAMGIKPDEMVPVYGTWSPDISAMFFALNAVGAHPYFEKIGIVPEELAKETGSAKVAIVHSSLWGSVKSEFVKSQYEKVIISSPADLTFMPMKSIISAQSFFESVKTKSRIPKDSRFIWADEARKIGDYYTGEYEVPFEPNRIAVINTSSGTTSSVVKGIVATNESAIANIVGTSLAEPNYQEGKVAFTNLPPAVATSLNSLFLLPIYRGMKVSIDPRITEDSLYGQIMENKPSVAIATGIYWEKFFKEVESNLAKGRKIDLSNADFFIMGGSGCPKETLDWMNSVLKKCNAPQGMISGYGLTEMFGVVSVDKYEKENLLKDKYDVIDVGIPIAGVTVGIFDENGNELSYGERGEIWIKGPSIMQGYYGKPEKTASVMQGDWFKTGDIAIMDENGYIYYYGRKKDTIKINNEDFYLFDIKNAIKKEFNLKDCMVEQKKLSSGDVSVVIYFVQKPDEMVDSKELCMQIDEFLESRGLHIDGYLEKYGTFDLSPATFKPQTRVGTGFVKYTSNGDYDVSYEETNTEDVLEMHSSPREKEFSRVKKI